MSGTLFVVATPIGNLEDVTLRALRVLREVDLIAAEDTRRTSNLLARHAIRTPLLSFHQHNVRSRTPHLLSRLQSGRTVALVTDAGTPGISDPGVELVKACLEAQIPVESIPGATAPLAAAVLSGFPLIPMTILGFPPTRLKDRTGWFQESSRIRHTFTFFESPQRVARTMKELVPYLGLRPIVVARELTKVHQSLIRGTAPDIFEQLQQVKGEVTVVIGPEIARDMSNDQFVEPARAAAVAYFGQLAEGGATSRRQAVSLAARRFGLSAKTVYQAVEQAKGSAK
ncbi:MAG TPA: 16S rRNA (cytidine(1402)-2'-O)-methyltransferase [Vicinamibacterales bacterium]|nr:16S rRNA (cytidine(1402)-2'-O)-methyltransferase [Vicinamibacterales bacterium]